MHLERIQFENKEPGISLDGLKDANAELHVELEGLKKQLLQLRMQKDSHGEDTTRDRRKVEMMREMMSSFPQFHADDTTLNVVLAKIETAPLSTEEARVLRGALEESRALSRRTEKLLRARGDDADTLAMVNSDLEKRLAEMEGAYAEILGVRMGEAGGDAEELRAKMEMLMVNVRKRGEEGENSIKSLLEERERENARLRAVVEDYKNSSSSLKVGITAFLSVDDGADGSLVVIMLRNNLSNSKQLKRVLCGIFKIDVNAYVF
jgi:kinesin family protein 5